MQKGTAIRYLAGQRRIDEMRKEIIEVVSGVLGLIPSKVRYEGVVVLPHFDSNCVWELRIEDRECPGGTGYYGYNISPRCYPLPRKGRGSLFSKDTSLRTPAIISPEDVARVHASLDAFVRGVTKTFPGTAKMLKPYLTAARS